MDAKKTMVTLETPSGATRAFEVAHAENIMRMPDHGGWRESKEETKFVWTDEGFKPRKDKGGDKVSK